MSTLFTKQGLEELKKKLETLKASRPEAVLDLKKAREMGDLSENGYYKSARGKLSAIDRELRYIERLIKAAKVATTSQTDFVEIGHTVLLLSNNQEVSYTIVGTHESNPAKGAISHVSPLGKALLGKRKNDVVTITIPSGVVAYTILEIR